MSNAHIDVEFVSVFQEGNISTSASLNLNTGEVFAIVVIDDEHANTYKQYIMAYIRIDDDFNKCYDVVNRDGTCWIDPEDAEAVRQMMESK